MALAASPGDPRVAICDLGPRRNGAFPFATHTLAPQKHIESHIDIGVSLSLCAFRHSMFGIRQVVSKPSSNKPCCLAYSISRSCSLERIWDSLIPIYMFKRVLTNTKHQLLAHTLVCPLSLVIDSKHLTIKSLRQIIDTSKSALPGLVEADRRYSLATCTGTDDNRMLPRDHNE